MTHPTYADADPSEMVSLGGGTVVSLGRAVQEHMRQIEAGKIVGTTAFRDHGKEPAHFGPSDLEALAKDPRFSAA